MYNRKQLNAIVTGNVTLPRFTYVNFKFCLAAAIIFLSIFPLGLCSLQTFIMCVKVYDLNTAKVTVTVIVKMMVMFMVMVTVTVIVTVTVTPKFSLLSPKYL
jgi:hypothetical protein